MARWLKSDVVGEGEVRCEFADSEADEVEHRWSNFFPGGASERSATKVARSFGSRFYYAVCKYYDDVFTFSSFLFSFVFFLCDSIA